MMVCDGSGFTYARDAMNHILGLPKHSDRWKDLFDVVVCSANKPTFFSSKKPFRQWSEVSNTAHTTLVTSLDKGKVYINGSVHAVKKFKGWYGNQVLYVGDNMW